MLENKMIKPYASIVILTYKQFDNLENNIKSISAQSYKNYEVVIQDDGSPNFDSSEISRLCKKYFEEGNYKINTNNKNLGTVKNYNRAIKNASGEVIIPLSQDDIFASENSLQYIIGFFNKPDVNICCSKRQGKVSKTIYPTKTEINYINELDYSHLLICILYRNFISGASLIWRKDFLTKLGGYDENYILMEDYPMILKLLKEGYSISFLDQVTVNYGENGVSSGNFSPTYIEDNVHLFNDLLENSEKYVKSKLCIQLIKYNLLYWKGLKNGKRTIDLSLINIYLLWDITAIIAHVLRTDKRSLRLSVLLKAEDKTIKGDKL